MSEHHDSRKEPFIPGEIMVLIEQDKQLTSDGWTEWFGEIEEILKTHEETEASESSLFREQNLIAAGETLERLNQNRIDLSLDGKRRTLVILVLNPLVPRNLLDLSHDGEVRVEADLDRLAINTINVVNSLNANRNRYFFNAGISFRAAAPNWIFAGAPHTIADGGPGGWPIPTPIPNNLNEVKFDISVARLAETGASRASSPDSQRSVNVAILDTLLSNDEFNKLDILDPPQELWQSLKPNIRDKHHMSLLPPTKTETEVFFTHKDDSGNHQAEAHDYTMSNHGTFIAGIVHGHSDTANIYLIETLNRYGVGSTISIARSLKYLAETYIDNNSVDEDKGIDFSRGSALIINCSFCVGFANLCELEMMGLNPYTNICQLDQTVVMQPLWAAFDMIQELCQKRGIDLRITAAAGNDGIEGLNYTPPARFPAAFPDVIGVGSCDDALSRSWYSNQADAPPPAGLLTYGGKSTNNGTKTLSNEGIVGIYVGPIADGTPKSPESNGWARWSGTSFATASMTGMLAVAANDGKAISANVQSNFYSSLQSKAGKLNSNGEKIVFGKQG